MIDDLRARFLTAIEAIKKQAQASTLLRNDFALCPPSVDGNFRVLAIGKASRTMMDAVLAEFGNRIESGLCIGQNKDDSISSDWVSYMSGEHPVPGSHSFLAGREAIDFARSARKDGAAVVALLSGGASSLCEWPAAGHTREELVGVHRRAISAGLAIESINEQRAQVSAVKGGGLADLLGSSLVDVRVLVDIPTGDIDVVGSGPFDSAAFCGVKRAIGSPNDLITMAEHAFAPLSITRVNACSWELARLSELMVQHAIGGHGLWVTAGEVGVALPSGLLAQREGGRAQHLALTVARKLDAITRPWAIATWASDGCDGKGGSGAIITSLDRPKLLEEEASAALKDWQSGSYLSRIGCRLNSFASETNLTDLYMVLCA